MPGEKIQTILKNATKVEVYRVHPQLAEAAFKGEAIGSHQILKVGKEKGKEFASKLAAALVAEKTYQFGPAKACIFSPGVAFRFWKEGESVSVLLCFDCNDLMIFQGEKDIWEKGWGGDFSPARAALVKLVQEVFPDDKEIQGLKESQE